MKYNHKIEAWANSALPVPSSWKLENPVDEKDPEAGDIKEKEIKQENGFTTDNGVKQNGHVNGDSKKEEAKQVNELKDPLKKPVVLDDGRWTVISWYITLPLR